MPGAPHEHLVDHLSASVYSIRVYMFVLSRIWNKLWTPKPDRPRPRDKSPYPQFGFRSSCIQARLKYPPVLIELDYRVKVGTTVRGRHVLVMCNGYGKPLRKKPKINPTFLEISYMCVCWWVFSPLWLSPVCANLDQWLVKCQPSGKISTRLTVQATH